jgi:nucleotide-binding universal stress UspA family protein
VNEEAKLRVLWATDGSDHSESVIPLLRSLVLPAAEQITVLTVAPQTFLGGARPDPAFLTKVSAAARRKAIQDARAVAGRWLTELNPGHVGAEADARWGHPVREILKGARTGRVDIIALGAKGHSNLHMLVLGSVAQGVAQLTTQPLLVARPGARSVRRVVVGFDGSAPARKALRFLARLALPADAEVVLVHVLERDGAGRRSRADEAAGTEEETRASKTLGDGRDYLAGRGLTARTQVVWGRAADELDAVARREKADLVVVGSRKPSATQHYLIGSTAEKLVRHAQSSVLVVR